MFLQLLTRFCVQSSDSLLLVSSCFPLVCSTAGHNAPLLHQLLFLPQNTWLAFPFALGCFSPSSPPGSPSSPNPVTSFRYLLIYHCVVRPFLTTYLKVQPIHPPLPLALITTDVRYIIYFLSPFFKM